jgi:hypothetical protein
VLPVPAAICALRSATQGGYGVVSDVGENAWEWHGTLCTDSTEPSVFGGTCLLLDCRKSHVPVRMPARGSREAAFYGHRPDRGTRPTMSHPPLRRG